MVELIPDIGPQNGVRRPCGLSASFRASQEQPASTVTVMSSGLIDRIRFMRVVSIEIVFGLTGT